MGLGHQEHGESRWSCTLQHQRLTIQGGGKANAVPSSPTRTGIKRSLKAQAAVDLMILGLAS